MIEKIRLRIKIWWYKWKGWEEVYKICAYDSFESTYGSMMTIWKRWDEGRRLEYKIGKVKRPPSYIPNSQLFCFDNLTDAKGFVTLRGRKIFLCLARITNSNPRKMAHPAGDIKEYKRFWKDGKTHRKASTPHPGTIYCDRVLPIRVVCPPFFRTT